MSTATALVISPFLRFPKFSNSKLDFRRKFASFSLYTRHKSSPLTIAKIRTTAEDEAMGVSFEKKEVFVDGSSSSASAGLNATLNSLWFGFGTSMLEVSSSKPLANESLARGFLLGRARHTGLV
ncbi:hypothetical protein KY285_013247 [Solanum tuberosum]|nr:hypothetical protein KY285_013247 [Solanum tuberosum]